MLRAFSTAATGMTAQQMIVDVIANNLANINTTGFKRSQVDFKDLMYVKAQGAGGESAAGIQIPTGLEIGAGVRPGSTLKIYSQGDPINTAQWSDLAIQGDGFFRVLMPDGSYGYTRDGSFRVNMNGDMVTSDGYMVDGNVNIPDQSTQVTIGRDGTVKVKVAGSDTMQDAGQIKLYRFRNPAGLSADGNNLLAETPASGQAQEAVAGQDGTGEILQGFLEKSNVQMVTELVNLITAQRAYEVNSKAIKTGDEMLTTATRLIS